MEILKETPIQVNHLTGNITTLETADIRLTTGNTLFTTFGPFQ